MNDTISRQAAIEACESIKRSAVIEDGEPLVRKSAVKYVLDNLPSAQSKYRAMMSDGDCISRQAAIDEIDEWIKAFRENGHKESAADARLIQDGIIQLPSAQPEIAENLYLCKCYITDKDGLQHEVIHTGDIRRLTGWEI